MSVATGLCDSYCEHGGVCMREFGHDGLHDSKYCQWDDEHALSKEDANAVFRGKSPIAEAVIALTDVFEAIVEGEA